MLSDGITYDSQGISTAQKLKLHVDRLERAAAGASAFAIIQHQRVCLNNSVPIYILTVPNRTILQLL